jgi:hypothetical protein
MGTIVKATKSDAIRANATVKPRGFVNSPASPWAKISGTNTITLVKVEAVIAMETSVAPFMAAVFLSSPISRCLKIFSSTTTELSTIMPTPRARPLKVIRFRVYPPKYIATKVVITAKGIEIKSVRVVLIFLRKI